MKFVIQLDENEFLMIYSSLRTMAQAMPNAGPEAARECARISRLARKLLSFAEQNAKFGPAVQTIICTEHLLSLTGPIEINDPEASELQDELIEMLTDLLEGAKGALKKMKEATTCGKH